MFAISDATAADSGHIDNLLDQSFGIERRVKTSYRLREGSAPVPGLSLVVRDDALGIAGTISFWPLCIGDSGTPALLLGPLAVSAQRQKLGIGQALMREGLARARTRGHGLVMLVGDLPYYGRVGFTQVPDDRLILPGPWNARRLLWLELVPGASIGVSGLVLPPHRFGRGSAAFAVPHARDHEEQRAEA
jgi:predicted N-acetyltransferase YhbS